MFIRMRGALTSHLTDQSSTLSFLLRVVLIQVEQLHSPQALFADECPVHLSRLVLNNITGVV